MILNTSRTSHSPVTYTSTSEETCGVTWRPRREDVLGQVLWIDPLRQGGCPNKYPQCLKHHKKNSKKYEIHWKNHFFIQYAEAIIMKVPFWLVYFLSTGRNLSILGTLIQQKPVRWSQYVSMLLHLSRHPPLSVGRRMLCCKLYPWDGTLAV